MTTTRTQWEKIIKKKPMRKRTKPGKSHRSKIWKKMIHNQREPSKTGLGRACSPSDDSVSLVVVIAKHATDTSMCALTN